MSIKSKPTRLFNFNLVAFPLEALSFLKSAMVQSLNTIVCSVLSVKTCALHTDDDAIL